MISSPCFKLYFTTGKAYWIVKAMYIKTVSLSE